MRVAPWAGGMFAVNENGSVSPLSVDEYSLEVRSTTLDGVRVPSRKIRQATEVVSEVVVRWLTPLTLNDRAGSYREALDGEAQVVIGLVTPLEGTAQIRVRPQSIDRQVTDHDWLVHTLTARVDHTLTLIAS